MPWAFFDCAWLKVCDIMGLCVTVAGVDWLSIFLFWVLGLVPNIHIRWLRSTVTPVHLPASLLLGMHKVPDARARTHRYVPIRFLNFLKKITSNLACIIHT